MSRRELESGEFALLGRLNRSPLELGDLPASSVARLAALGLARKVLGFCEITRAGQLEWQRGQFRKVSRRWVARVTRHDPLFLQETRLHGPAGTSQLRDGIARRRTFDEALRGFTFPRKWVACLSNFTGRNTAR